MHRNDQLQPCGKSVDNPAVSRGNVAGLHTKCIQDFAPRTKLWSRYPARFRSLPPRFPRPKNQSKTLLTARFFTSSTGPITTTKYYLKNYKELCV